MNGNDLMDALSGLDPNFIDEAALELHDMDVRRKRARRKRMTGRLSIVLPVAAALLITALVALPNLIRTSKTDSGNMASESATHEAASDGAAYEAEMPSMSEAPMADEAMSDEPAYDGPVYSESEPAEAEESAEAEIGTTADTAGTNAASSQLNTDETASATEKTEAEAAIHATYEDGILRTDTDLDLPADDSGLQYLITGTDDSGSDITYAQGSLDDIITERDPLTLDISGLDLPDGSYILTIDACIIEFTIE